MTGLDARDLAQLAARGISAADAAHQLGLLRRAPPSARLLRPCSLGDGIRTVDPHDPELRAAFARAARTGRIGKFVPASGAATRMFASLLRARAAATEANEPDRTDEENTRDLARLAAELDRLPFADEVPAADRRDPRRTLAALLDADRLDLPSRPKGLLPFHRAPGHRGRGASVRTAFEEHLHELAELLAEPGAPSLRAHFTVSSAHRAAFAHELARVRGALPFATALLVTFSEQSPATDTLAADQHGDLRRDAAGALELRPGGHGALLPNLEAAARDAGFDLAGIKNIDNVRPAAGRAPVVLESRALLGLLVVLEERAGDPLRALERGGAPAALAAAAAFVTGELMLADPGVWQNGVWQNGSLENAPVLDASARLRHILRRPLRVCGVVPHRGEPGGGPFWVRDEERGAAPQIVEWSQIDHQDPEQARVLARATHFNPVALFCTLRDPGGQPYPLAPQVDPETWFVAVKSTGGEVVRALERPGLWNGAMAGWNTVFVEMTAATFAPVKTVFDLLRPEHQG